MATKAQIKKKAIKLGVVEKLEKQGFILGPDNLWFYRQRGELIDTIDFWLNSSKKFIKVPVSTWVKEVVYFADMQEFPKGFIKYASNISGMYLSDEKVDYSASFSVQTEKDIEEFLQLLVKNTSKYAIPWFEKNSEKRGYLY